MSKWLSSKQIVKEFKGLNEILSLIIKKLKDEESTFDDIEEDMNNFNNKAMLLEENYFKTKKHKNIVIFLSCLILSLLTIINVIFQLPLISILSNFYFTAYMIYLASSLCFTSMFAKYKKQIDNSIFNGELKELLGQKNVKYIRSNSRVDEIVKVQALVDGEKVEGQYLDQNMQPMTITRELNDYEVALWIIDFYICNHDMLEMPDNIDKIIIHILQEDLNTEESDMNKLFQMLDWKIQNDFSQEFNQKCLKYKKFS